MNRKKLVRRTIAAIGLHVRHDADLANVDEFVQGWLSEQFRHLFRTQLVWAVRHHKIKLGEFNAT